MSMEDLAAVAMASLMPEIVGEMERTITGADWCSIGAGEIGLGLDILMRGNMVKVACSLQRESGGEQLFVVSRTLAPAAQA